MIHIRETASSLSRILKHSKGKFGIVSAFLDSKTYKDNLRDHSKLKKDIRDLGYGFIELESYWEENGVQTEEKSLFIPNISQKDLVSLGEKYDQYAVLYGDDGAIKLICTNEFCSSDNSACIGCVYKTLSGTKISESVLKDAFSRLKKGSHKNKHFQFKGIREVQRTNGLPYSS